MVIVEYDENHIDKIVWNFNGFILKITKSVLFEKKQKILGKYCYIKRYSQDELKRWLKNSRGI